MILAAVALQTAAAAPAATAPLKPPVQAVWEAERAFAASAQVDGQWKAFRAYSAPEGVMFAPEMRKTHELLADAKEPPLGSLKWGPSRAITACDGSVAFSSGPWTSGKGQGTFSTIWKRQPDGGWKWLYDSGRDTPAKVDGARLRTALPVCRSLDRATGDPGATGKLTLAQLTQGARPDLLVQEDNRMPASAARAGLTLDVGERLVGGLADDGSLVWQVAALAGGKAGAHMLRVWTWDGGRYRLAVLDVVGL